jgi:DNA-directed DNA polymerase III PolC
MFIHLNCHSNYSLLAGADKVEDLTQAAADMGLSSLALTDTNNLYAAVHFYRAALHVGIRPIFGVEIATGDAHSPQCAVVLAKDQQGFAELCRIITDRQLRPDFLLSARLKQCSHHVIIISSSEKVLRDVANERGNKNLYVELTRFGDGAQYRALKLARLYGLECVVTNRVFFIHREDWETHRLLSAIRTNTTVQTLPSGAIIAPEAWMKSPQDMVRLFDDFPDAIRNSARIAEMCDVSLTLGEVKFPPFDLPPGESYASLLGKLAHKGLRKYYREVTPAATRRLRYELQVINDLSFAPYFLIVWDIVREAVSRNIPTVGRGSAANSLVCAALGITEVDPIKHNLYFERFLNPERTDYPDIDIDFPWNRRDEMLDYVFEKYGQDNVALISAHVHFRGRSIVREVGKAIGVPIPEIDVFTKRLPHFSSVSQLEEAREIVPECRDLPLEDEPYRSIIKLGKRIEGFPRHLSVHCGGIVVSPSPITDFIPLQKTPKGFVVTQYDMYPVEDMGLLKIDLLAQKGLAVLADTVREVEEHYGTKVDFTRIDPTKDNATRSLVKEGRTIGCFYIESPGMRNLLQKLGVENFDMLTAASSIIRPGVSESGMMKSFIDRHNGKEKVRYLHPKLEELLKETFGVMIYQEDVIKVAHAVAGMTLGEADSLRKCMSKKRDWEDMENYRNRFIRGALGNGVSPPIAEEIWRQIESFAGYAFCKAHSASFAVVSYQTAWLKAHYPAEFMAAVLSNQGGFYDTCAYTEEARRMGIKILHPDINIGKYEFAAERIGLGDGKRNAIRVGFMQVKGFARNNIQSVIDCRAAAGAYDSLTDFLLRATIDDSEAEALIRCGAFDRFGWTRPELLWQLKLFSKRSGLLSSASQDNHMPGFRACADMGDESHSLIPSLPQYDLREKLFSELECLDITVTSHLLSLYAEESAGLALTASRTGIPFIPARKIHKYAGRLVSMQGWLITAKRTRTSKNELMKFLTLEDATASFEVTLFPGIYRRFGHLLHGRGPYNVKGRVEMDSHCYTLTALWLGSLK